MSSPLVHEKVWVDKYKYEEAEKEYFERLAKQSSTLTSNSSPPAPSTAVTASTIPSPIVVAMPEVAPSPSVTPITNSESEQEKKKKRRKRNSNSGVSATGATNGTAGAASSNAVAGAIPESSTNKDSDKKAKEKKNEASKKGKKQSPEPKGPSSSPANPPPPTADDKSSSLASEVARARQHIKSSLECVDRISSFTNNPAGGADLVNRLVSLEKENEGLRKLVEKMQKSQDKFEARLNDLEKKCTTVCAPKAAPQAGKPAAAAPAKAAAKDDDDDDMDLFGSDSEEDEDAKRVKEQRLAEYAAKKSKKPALIAKSNVILDVKPWDDETDMKQLEEAVRSIQMDGLLWGASKLVPLAYGIKKLQISSVVEDEKVSIDLLTESIEEKSDLVQSVDIAAFNKI